jgi:hypothetical protein
MIPQLSKGTGRKDVLLPLNEHRFDSFNKDPKSCTKVARISTVNFGKLTGRDKAKSKSRCTQDYEPMLEQTQSYVRLQSMHSV